MGLLPGGPSGSAGHAGTLGMPAGGGVRMCVFAVTCGRYDPQVVRRVSGWAWHHLRRAALADFTCAIRCPACELEKTDTEPVRLACVYGRGRLHDHDQVDRWA